MNEFVGYYWSLEPRWGPRVITTANVRVYSVSQKIPPPQIFFTFFPKWLKIYRGRGNYIN